MKKIIDFLYKNQSLIYKVLLYTVSLFFIVYLFPKAGKFPYDFQKGKPWQYETLVAPFNFPIDKSLEELKEEEERIKANNRYYFEKDTDVANELLAQLYLNLEERFADSTALKVTIQKNLSNITNKLFEYGVLDEDIDLNKTEPIYLKTQNELSEITFGNLVLRNEIKSIAVNQIVRDSLITYQEDILGMLFNELKPNVFYNEELTKTAINEQIESISVVHGVQEKGFKIIARGEVVEGLKLNKLNSLRSKYETQTWNKSNFNWIVVGYTILVSLALLMLFLFIKKYRNNIFEDNNKMTFIVFNIVTMISITSLVVKYDSSYVYVVPTCILPLIIKAFFDARLGLFAHVITVLIIGFIIPDSFEYTFLQIIAGIVTILTVSELYKRVNLFISVGQIIAIYIIAYFAFFIIREGDILYFTNIVERSEIGEVLRWKHFTRFLLCGVAMLFVQPLIYIYEKFFRLVSDVSLLELSDTNSKLLKRLADEAPGTFHHSLNVANLAEAAANEIEANAMLVRVGALYHDIGKIKDPQYFTENQISNTSSHDELSPKESARIIINHVIDGIEIAKKNNLPDRVIDFIRTHHGTSTVYYFYKMAKEQNEQVNVTDFQYPGPAPFSKETAILMMCDSVEAASKSLKEPNAMLIDQFVEKIIDKQVAEGQFLNANITFKEIELIKKVLKKKLNNIYHLRIEYPD